MSQFEGYEKLQEIDLEGYRAKYGNIQRLDLILEMENDSANRYKLSKQPDVLISMQAQFKFMPEETFYSGALFCKVVVCDAVRVSVLCCSGRNELRRHETLQLHEITRPALKNRLTGVSR